MKEKGYLCRARPKKGPKLGKPYHVTDNKLDRDFQADKPILSHFHFFHFVFIKHAKIW